jgi:hypothetical protein
MKFNDTNWLYKIIIGYVNYCLLLGWILLPIVGYIVIFQNFKPNDNFEIPICILLIVISTIIFYYLRIFIKYYINKFGNL